MIEVRVADVQPVNDTTNVGVQFGGTGYGAGALGQFPYTLTKSSVVLNAQIDALIQRGHASILAQPRIATLNNREASLLIGEQYPVVTVNQQTGFPSRADDRRRRAPAPDADDRRGRHDHRGSPSRVLQIIGFNNSFPIVANRKVDATLRVRDGETIVLGGLFQDVDSETITKFPVLGDLPVLGGFFRNRQTTHNKRRSRLLHHPARPRRRSEIRRRLGVVFSHPSTSSGCTTGRQAREASLASMRFAHRNSSSIVECAYDVRMPV